MRTETQTSQLLQKLPTELLLQFFNNLKPINRRLLAATCNSCYIIYKKYFSNEELIVDISEILGTHPAMNTQSRLVGSREFRETVSKFFRKPYSCPLGRNIQGLTPFERGLCEIELVSAIWTCWDANRQRYPNDYCASMMREMNGLAILKMYS